MKTKIIRLTEHDLHKMIKESVDAIIKNKPNNIGFDINSIDISKIDVEILKKAYIDFRLIPTRASHDNFLSVVPRINEAEGDIMSPDNVIYEIQQKYNLNSQLIQKVEASHQIYIYIITACIGINDKLIEDDMNKMGYFLGFKGNIQKVGDMSFQILQFEPYSQMQNDETSNVKNKYNCLYHLTPEYCVNDILQNGLIPSHKNKMFNYPPRIYLIKGDCEFQEIIKLGQGLCVVNNNSNNKGIYFLLKINLKNLDDNIHFYYDPNSRIGMYTEQEIPPNNIEIIDKFTFKTKN